MLYKEIKFIYFIRKEFIMISYIKTPDDIMEVMKTIEYGWVDKDNNKHKKISKEMLNKYKLQSPKEVLKNKIGVCWDQVELQRYLFNKLGLDFKTYFICYYDFIKNPNHTFFVYKKDNKFYWFEHSFHKYKGIYLYDNLNDLFLDVKDKFTSQEIIKSYDDKDILIREYDKPKFNISVLEFYHHCEQNDPIKFK